MKRAVYVVLTIILLAIVIFFFYFQQIRKNSDNSDVAPLPIPTKCPKFIDCMPGPGRNTKCEVPKGCEDITEIAY